MKKKSMFLCLLIAASLCLSAIAADLSLDDVIKNLQGNQKKIKDMYAETTTKITSNLRIKNNEKTGPQTIVQKGRLWTKGEDMSKIEMTHPMKQITITNGDNMKIIDPDSGREVKQNLKKIRQQSGLPDSSKQMSLEKAKDFFNLSIGKKDGNYFITRLP